MKMIRNLCVAFLMMMSVAFAQNQIGFSSWNDVAKAPFEHDLVSQGADAVTGTFAKYFDTQIGTRYTYGADGSKPYERQVSVFAQVALLKAFKHGQIRVGEEIISTYRPNGVNAKNARPFAETWFGGGDKFPVSTWASFTNEQFGEGYVAIGSYNQGVRVARIKKFDLIVNGGPGFAYGQKSENPWNRQITVRGGVRIQRNVSNGQVGVGGYYIEAFRPNGQRDNVSTINVFWWFGKNITL